MAYVDSKLLEILVCPLTKTALIYDKENSRLISEATGLAYPIIEGIPIMLIDEAQVIDESKAKSYRETLLPQSLTKPLKERASS